MTIVMRWQDVDPHKARGIDLTKRDDITAPHNEKGERCPWPWGPQLLTEEPIGEYRCIFCRALVEAGKEHPDYRQDPPVPAAAGSGNR